MESQKQYCAEQYSGRGCGLPVGHTPSDTHRFIRDLREPKGSEVVTFKEGDWVRFYQDGRLVIAEVRYLYRAGVHQRLMICTDHGGCSTDNVLEVRRLAEYVKGDER